MQLRPILLPFKNSANQIFFLGGRSTLAEICPKINSPFELKFSLYERAPLATNTEFTVARRALLSM
jgi:hypothetical protein